MKFLFSFGWRAKKMLRFVTKTMSSNKTWFAFQWTGQWMDRKCQCMSSFIVQSSSLSSRRSSIQTSESFSRISYRLYGGWCKTFVEREMKKKIVLFVLRFVLHSAEYSIISPFIRVQMIQQVVREEKPNWFLKFEILFSFFFV